MRMQAEELRSQLEKPIYNPILKRDVGDGTLDYEVYLQTGTLLSLQTDHAERTAPEELMFQIVHQTQELWLKLLASEMVEIVAAFDETDLWKATAVLDRAVRILATMTDSMGVLETLTPDAYQIIRRSLGNGSGQESPGYNAVRLAAGAVGKSFESLLESRKLALLEVYAGGNDDVKRLSEQLLDLDEGFQAWLVAHYQLVRRTIGVAKEVRALDGISTQILVGRMTQPLFPSLWEVRVAMTERWSRAGGHAPGAARKGPGGSL